MNNSINVCILSPGLPVPPTKGGAIETIIFETVPFYQYSKAYVYSCQAKTEEVLKNNQEDAKYIQFLFSPFMLKVQKYMNRFADKGRFGLYNFRFIRKVLGSLDFQPDLFHLHNHFQYVSIIKKRFPKSKIILHMHNDFLFRYANLHSRYVDMIDRTDAIITVSQYLKKRIVQKYPQCADKIKVVHNGVRLDTFKKLAPHEAGTLQWRNQLGLNPEDKVILFVGRISAQKGVEFLIDAFSRLAQETAGIKLLIVGTTWFVDFVETVYLKQIKSMSAKIKDRIIFAGFVHHQDLNYLYNMATLCVIPSVFQDPFPLVSLEALSAGCPVIAAKVGGIPEIIIENKTGLLVPSENSFELYCKIKSLLLDNSLRERLSENGLKFVQDQYDFSNVARAYERIYMNVHEKKDEV